MNQEQALSVLIQAARVAQSKGAFTLEDAKVIAEAISVFVPAQPQPEGEVTEAAPEPEQAPMEAGN